MTTVNDKDKLPSESNWEFCVRRASQIDAEKFVGQLLLKIEAMEKKRRNSNLPLWSIVGDITSHGSGVSTAIVKRFLPDHQE